MPKFPSKTINSHCNCQHIRLLNISVFTSLTIPFACGIWLCWLLSRRGLSCSPGSSFCISPGNRLFPSYFPTLSFFFFFFWLFLHLGDTPSSHVLRKDAWKIIFFRVCSLKWCLSIVPLDWPLGQISNSRGKAFSLSMLKALPLDRLGGRRAWKKPGVFPSLRLSDMACFVLWELSDPLCPSTLKSHKDGLLLSGNSCFLVLFGNSDASLVTSPSVTAFCLGVSPSHLSGTLVGLPFRWILWSPLLSFLSHFYLFSFCSTPEGFSFFTFQPLYRCFKN